MKYALILAGGLLAIAGLSTAQAAPPPPPPPHGGPGLHEPPPPRPRGAHIRIDRLGNNIDIQCAADEPMRACVDAVSTLLDKLGPPPPRGMMLPSPPNANQQDDDMTPPPHHGPQQPPSEDNSPVQQ